MRKLAVILISLISVILLAIVPGCAKSTSVPLSSQAETQTTPPSISTTALPNGEVNIGYSQTLAAKGGSGAFSTWSIIAGNLPDGLSLGSSNGTINGMPNTSGTSHFTVQVIDSHGATASAELTITIVQVSITNTSLSNGTVNSAYSQTLSAIGGTGTYTAWSITVGALPAGLSLDTSTGIISGTPTAAGTFGFFAQVVDSKGITGSAGLQICIVTPGPSIVPTSLPNGMVNTAYSQQTLTAAGGSGTYKTWAILNGALPNGLSLGSTTGVISGTPTKAGRFDFVVQVTDSGNATGKISLSIIIEPVSITTTSLPNGVVKIAYSQILHASGGSGTYTWSIISGTLPAGLYFTGWDGEIFGSPTTTGSSNFTVQVIDSNGVTATKALSITIVAAT